MKMELELGVSEFYSQNKWFESYQPSIRPGPSSKLWKPNDFPKPLPPIERKIPRRPRKARIRHPTKNNHEISRRGKVMHCHKCWEVRHNKSTCKNPQIPKPSQSTTARRTETPVLKPSSSTTAGRTKTPLLRPPSSPPIMPPEGPPEPRSNAYKGKGKCPLKPKKCIRLKKGTGVRIGSPIRMGSTTATRLSDRRAKQTAIRKIWEETKKYDNEWPGVDYDYFSPSEENKKYNIPLARFVNDYNHFEEVPLVTPSNPAPSNPTVKVQTQKS
nr:hypothetical protein [Tanacetum cinerariifolium]